MVEVELHVVGYVVVGAAVLAAAVLPRMLSEQPLSVPILYVAAGVGLFLLPGLNPPNPVRSPALAERLTELVVIISLMGAGLKLDRPFSLRGWTSTWRLLAIAMPITVVSAVLLGTELLGVNLATAVLLGAVVAPTDPVLASDVEAGPPLAEIEEDADAAEQVGTVRFALTSEAGLNDGLAFPITYLAIAIAAAGAASPASVLGEWLLVDVGYKIVVGVALGYAMGWLLARLVFRIPSTSHLAQTLTGTEVLAATFLTYGITELLQGYGFIAVFVGAMVLRQFEWEHEYYRRLHDFAVMAERLLMAAVLVLFGGAIAGGLLAPLTPVEVVVGLALVLVVRPVAGLVGLLGFDASWWERGVISTFGIRGIGSFFYLSYALNHASFGELELLVTADRLWALVGFIVVTSIVVHGIAASPVMNALDRWRKQTEGMEV